MANAEEASPQMAHSVQALAARWSQVMKDYRFLTSAEFRGKPAGRETERLLKVEHDGAVLYPEFQFDEAGQVRRVILELVSLAENTDWSEQSLVLWLVTPTGFLDDEKPIEHLGDPERILAGVRSRFEQSW
ncbi:hypothetical protein ASH00_15895 [Arthrobacter sp. Soil782]|uniref:hypothetical protein n=1 Tax=Arthrobacter sp. Soil782 TaxID=1736410 RepID=UPI0006F42E7F|nr:hypothetical protein [Arthrobacter sp. Soil782]KRF03267.1 hypothetical protein ASH00_15895 [Arthrobacter sp. Soil782]